LVPEGVEVEVQARTQVGRTNLQASSGIPGAPRIVLTGGTFFGDIKVRHRRWWEKLGAGADSPSSPRCGFRRLPSQTSHLESMRVAEVGIRGLRSLAFHAKQSRRAGAADEP
ncbi:MAG: hypothetical protein ACXVXL_28260, partial [Solirubrobacteraceae bacterium]